MDHRLVVAKGLESLREAMSYAVQGHPRRTGHSREFRLNVIHLEKELANHSSIMPRKLHGHKKGEALRRK